MRESGWVVSREAVALVGFYWIKEGRVWGFSKTANQQNPMRRNIRSYPERLQLNFQLQILDFHRRWLTEFLHGLLVYFVDAVSDLKYFSTSLTISVALT